MIVYIQIPNSATTFNLVVIRWYDFKYRDERRLFKYNCPLLTLLDDYQCIPIEAISSLIHVVPRFGKENEHFVNSFLF